MSIEGFDRRQFLTLGLALALVPTRLLAAEPGLRRGAYALDVGLLYSMLNFHLEGSYEERVDRAAGRYTMFSSGQGDQISSRIESRGALRDGRWTPERATSYFEIYGRESRTESIYDFDRRSVEYHARGETFMMRRLRVVDDVLAMPPGLQVDDASLVGRWRRITTEQERCRFRIAAQSRLGEFQEDRLNDRHFADPPAVDGWWQEIA